MIPADRLQSDPDCAAWPDWVGAFLDDFLPALAREMPVDVRERLAIEAWLQTAWRQGWLPGDANKARAALRGIVAKTPQEQASFDAVFDAVFEAARQPSFLPPRPPRPDPPPDRLDVLLDWWWLDWLWRWWSAALRTPRASLVMGWTVMVLVAALAWAAWLWWGSNETVPVKVGVDPVPVAASQPAPASGPEIVLPVAPSASGSGVAEVQRLTDPWLFGVHPAFYAALVAVLAAMLWSWRSAGQAQLARLTTRERLREQEVYARELLPVSGERRRLLREAARSLRRPVGVEGRLRLDLPASVRASAAAAGVFRTIRRAEPVTPEYLVLIDRAGLHDQQAHWSAEIVRDLVAEGVSLLLFEYDHDPRWVAPLRTTRSTAAPHSAQRFQSLHTLAAQHGGRGLIVVGDGAGCLDPLTGWISANVEVALRPWPRRVLLTPRPAAGWGRGEAVLAGEGAPAGAASFLVLPAQIGSLVGAAGWLRAGVVPDIDVVPGAPGAYPALLADDPGRWLGREPPDADAVAAMVPALRRYLGSVAFGWLAASAAYPLLSPDLTALLARQLTWLAHDVTEEEGTVELLGDARLHEARLMAIGQLPWCRAGYMPDWLRRVLFESLPPLQRERVRALLVALLRKAGGDARDATLSLGRIAQDELTRSRRRTDRFWRRLRGWVLPADEPADSPLRDVIYLGVLRGDFDRTLVLEAPEDLVRTVQATTARPLTRNPVRWVAAMGWVWVYPGFLALWRLRTRRLIAADSAGDREGRK